MADEFAWASPFETPFTTAVPPALASFQNRLYLAWQGEGPFVYCSTSDGSSWTSAQQIIGPFTVSGPSLAVFRDLLYCATGGTYDTLDTYLSSFDGNSWSVLPTLPKTLSQNGPAIAAFQDRLYCVYATMLEVPISPWNFAISWATFDGASWSATQTIPGVSTSFRPSIAVFRNRLYAAWKGLSNDSSLWYSSFDGNSWAPQQQIPGVGSEYGPSLAVCGNTLYAIWKSIPTNDFSVWWSSFDGHNWAPQQLAPPSILATLGPSIANFNDILYSAWVAWETQANICVSHLYKVIHPTQSPHQPIFRNP
jgi:hypothetical protein